VARHNNGQVEKRSAGDETDATDQWVGLLRHLPQQASKVEAETNPTDAGSTRYHAKY